MGVFRACAALADAGAAGAWAAAGRADLAAGAFAPEVVSDSGLDAALAAGPEAWQHLVQHEHGRRHYVSLYRDADIDVWLLCWNTEDDTGWHDHDSSSGAVAVTRGAVLEHRPRLGGDPHTRTVEAGRTFSFGPEHIHRMAGAVDGSVSIHAYSPPLWRMGQYAISPSGTMRRYSVSYADELRPRGAGLGAGVDDVAAGEQDRRGGRAELGGEVGGQRRAEETVARSEDVGGLPGALGGDAALGVQQQPGQQRHPWLVTPLAVSIDPLKPGQGRVPVPPAQRALRRSLAPRVTGGGGHEGLDHAEQQ